MDVMIELFFELVSFLFGDLVDSFWDRNVNNPKRKLWVKILVILLFLGPFAALFGYLFARSYIEGSQSGMIVSGIFFSGPFSAIIFFIIRCIIRQRKWRKSSVDIKRP